MKKTALHDTHVKLGGRIVDFAGEDHVAVIEYRGETKLRPADLEAAIARAEVNLNDWARY